MFELLLKNAQVYAPEYLGQMDIGVAGGKVSAMGLLSGPAARVIDCTGLVAMPGAIETHAHMNLPFGGTRTMNDFYDGTRAAAFGGVTTLIDFGDQAKGQSAVEAIDARLAEAKRSAIDYSLHCTLTDINEETCREIPVLAERGFTSFKFYTTYSESGLYVSPEDMQTAFVQIVACGALATVHAEDEAQIHKATSALITEGKTGVQYFPASKPDASEADAIEGVIRLAEKTGAKLLIRHVSSAAGARLIAQAQSRGVMVIGETCPHYLCLTRDVYAHADGARFIVHPPIRGEADREALWQALRQGVKFLMGTDDCAFYLSQKNVSTRFYEIPGGMPGIETRVPIALSLGVGEHGLPFSELVHLLATDVAKVYGIYPRKGVIRIGSDADIALIDPYARYTLRADMLHEKSDYTPFEGMRLTMRVEKTILRGKVIMEDGVFKGSAGAGLLLDRGNPCDLPEL